MPVGGLKDAQYYLPRIKAAIIPSIVVVFLACMAATLDKQVAEALTYARIVDFALDKDFYNPGDEVTITVKSPIFDGALLTLDVIEGNSDRRVFHTSQILVDEIARQAERDGIPISDYYYYDRSNRPPPSPVIIHFTLPLAEGVDHYRLSTTVYDLKNVYSDYVQSYSSTAILFTKEAASRLFITDVKLDTEKEYRPGEGMPLSFGIKDGLGKTIGWPQVSISLCHENGNYCPSYSMDSPTDTFSTVLAIPQKTPNGSYKLTISPVGPSSSPNEFGGEPYIVERIVIEGDSPFAGPSQISQHFDYSESANVLPWFRNDGWLTHGQNLTLMSKQYPTFFGTNEDGEIVKPPLKGVRVNFSILDPEGTVIYNKTHTVNSNGEVLDDFPITSNLKRGVYEVYHKASMNDIDLDGGERWAFHVAGLQQFNVTTSPEAAASRTASLPLTVYFSSRDLDASNLIYNPEERTFTFEVKNNHLYNHRHFNPAFDFESGIALVSIPKHLLVEPMEIKIGDRNVDFTILEEDYFFSGAMGTGEIINPYLVDGNPSRYSDDADKDHVLLRVGPIYDDEGELTIELLGISNGEGTKFDEKNLLNGFRDVLRLKFVQFTDAVSPLQAAEVGRVVYFSAWVENDYDEYRIDIPYVAIVQVVDENGVTEVLTLQNGTVGNPETGSSAQVWLEWFPQKVGKHEAKVFILNNLENPQILSMTGTSEIEILPNSEQVRPTVPDTSRVIEIGQTKEIELKTYEAGGNDGTFAKARITFTNVTTHTGTFEHLEYKKGFITLVLNYTVENLDNFAFYAQPDFDAIVDGDTYPYQAISGALGNLLLPHETRESFVIFQVVEDAREVMFDVRDVYSGKDTLKSLWKVSIDIS